VSGSAAERVVVDTTLLSWDLTDRAAPLAKEYDDFVVGRTRIASFASEAEPRFGAAKAGWGPPLRQRLERLLLRTDVLWPDRHLARTYAQLRLHCHRKGHPLASKHHEADRWIAATALRLGVPLVTHDRAFLGVDGLDVLTRLD
jgi:predicted nucleic acid-binding protein